MNRFVCHVQLSDGGWGGPVTEIAVEQAVESCTRRDCVLVRLDFLAPDHNDVLLAFEAEFEAEWSHSEVVRDGLIEVLLRHFRPEYESMIEVEVLDD